MKRKIKQHTHKEIFGFLSTKQIHKLIKTLSIVDKVKMKFCFLITLLVLTEWTESINAESYFPASSGNFIRLFSTNLLQKRKKYAQREQINKKKRTRSKTNKPIFIVIFVRVFKILLSAYFNLSKRIRTEKKGYSLFF